MAPALICNRTLIGGAGSTPAADAAVLLEGDRLALNGAGIVTDGEDRR